MNEAQLKEIEEIILQRIAAILEEVYHEAPTQLDALSISARLAFRADPHLNELRLALQRIARGEYGNCIFCKGSIPLEILRDLPTAHFCDNCAGILRRRTAPSASSQNI